MALSILALGLLGCEARVWGEYSVGIATHASLERGAAAIVCVKTEKPSGYTIREGGGYFVRWGGQQVESEVFPYRMAEHQTRQR